ncbi:MAG: Jag N-terminal domain-containing protein [Desulfobulbaceae bacterium]|nr:Jag N-terminal domain-containing protein [Desulfobulbaceae bacterium]HIJ79264.1 single-stranded DNA-binding protein [Deltaproteobacteria bacterium]
MSAKMEYNGSDVDEAIRNACAALKVERDQVDVEIVATGSTGVFGIFGRKKAVVRVGLKNGGAKGKAQSRPARAGQDEAVVKVRSKREDVVGDPVSAEDIELIKSDLGQILALMNCPSEITIDQDANNKVHAHISGEHVEVIVGAEGQTLDGLQYLMRKIITRKFPQKVLFSLDAGDFRSNRTEELQERAVRLAQEVKDTGKTRTIPAINPAERRIVHMALQNDTEIRSRSVGDGIFKKVLIYLPGKGRKRTSRKRKGGEARPR